MNNHEQKFYDALRDIFVGAKVEGESGYINLMRIKSRYFTEGVFPRLQKDIDEACQPFDAKFREELFDKLYTFFSRYFSESGSIYFRYTPLHQNVYEKVYTDDKDVMLFWKTHMLYYVKTDRLFNNLDVEVDGVKFFFDVSAMEHKKSNEKRELIYEFKERRGDGVLAFTVTHSERGRKTKIDEMLRALKTQDAKVGEETLERAFRVFEKQSEVDYFINKNAKAFLQEQFDLWMYQYVFKGESVWSEARIAQLQTLKRIAYSIIDFISQFEDELVKIWNKPKFVLNSNYVITLDRIASAQNAIESNSTAQKGKSLFQTDLNLAEAGVSNARRTALLEKIISHPNFKSQLEEWRALGIVDDAFKKSDAFESAKQGRRLAEKYQHLPIDTKHFKDLELEILALFENLDDALDGWLIKSENYQALNTILLKFKQKVKCIYIDPPYNATTTEIIYANAYKHATWLSFMDDRIDISRKFLESKGVYVIAIDENEQERLGLVLRNKFPESQITCVTVVHNPSGQQGDNFSYSHDYAYFVYPKVGRIIGHDIRDEDNADTRNFRDVTGAESLREAAANCFYPILVKDGEILGFGDVSDDDFHPGSPNIIRKNGVIEIYPIDPENVERKWRFARQTVETVKDQLRVKFLKKREVWDIERSKNTFNFKTVWSDSKYSANNHGTQLLNNIVGKDLFTFPKSIFTVMDSLRAGLGDTISAYILDFFAGSGTTAHATINLNRADSGKRKYILVEMGEHFDTVILPRIKKVVFCEKWKDGKAAGGKGVSHFCKYYSLEQYEDTLRRVKYDDAPLIALSQDPYTQYVFLRDLKMLDALDVDTKANTVKVDLSRLYDGIDIAETLSNLTGKWIKRVARDRVEFTDGETVDLKNLDWKLVKPLIWW